MNGERNRGWGGRGGRGAGDYRALTEEPGSHLLFIGSYSCTRHRGGERLALQREGKLSFLCLQEIDWITGDYLSQIEQAAREVTETYGVKKLILCGGCQLELLNADMPAMAAQLTEELGIPVVFHKGCHLVGHREGEDD